MEPAMSGGEEEQDDVFLQASSDEDAPGSESGTRGVHMRKRRKREANVYDAVAGRVTTTLPLDDDDLSDSSITASRPTHHRRPILGASLRDPTLAPEEVLFRRAGAPVRYAEKDIYHAADRLPDYGQNMLPNSDMLKAIHNYTSQFYKALALGHQENREGRQAGYEHQGSQNVSKGGLGGESRDGNVECKCTENGTQNRLRSFDDRSMDETALLAFGILLEEAGREALGPTGDLVFTEGVRVAKSRRSKSRSECVSDGDEQVIGLISASGTTQKRRPRRSSTAHETE